MEINKNDMEISDETFRNAMAEPQNSSDEAIALWENGFAKKVTQQNFYRFGFNHFNVFTLATVSYTALSIVVLLLGSAYYAAKHVDLGSVTKQKPSENQVTDISIHKDSSTNNTSQQNTHNVPTSNTSRNLFGKQEKLMQDNSIHSVDSIINPIEGTQEKNTVIKTLPLQSNDQDQFDPKTTPMRVVKKTIVIEKRDTLETVDTIRSKKEWRKINKK